MRKKKGKAKQQKKQESMEKKRVGKKTQKATHAKREGSGINQ